MRKASRSAPPVFDFRSRTMTALPCMGLAAVGSVLAFSQPGKAGCAEDGEDGWGDVQQGCSVDALDFSYAQGRAWR